MSRSMLLVLALLPGACSRDPASVVADSRVEPPCGGRCDGPTPRVDSPPPRLDGTDRVDRAPDHSASSNWACQAGSSGRTVCSTPGGLPPGGSDWRCHQRILGPATSTWICYGQGSADPSGDGWTCSPAAVGSLWKCAREAGTSDQPPGGGIWTCWMSSKAGGITCEKRDPGKPPGSCYPGQRMWCDSLIYDGWGQVECDAATGTWKRTANGDIDCRFNTDRRPDTVCACYFLYFNQSCCERPDCILPDGSSGATCPASPGGLCSHCNPSISECSSGKCVVTNAHETFCGQTCETAACPAGYDCMTIKLSGGQTSKQCVPTDLSCYY